MILKGVHFFGHSITQAIDAQSHKSQLKIAKEQQQQQQHQQPKENTSYAKECETRIWERERKNSKKTGNSSLWSCHYIDYNTHSQFFLTYCGPKRECKKSIQEAISGPPFSITRPIHARKLFSKNENTARAFRQDRELFELQDFAISFRDQKLIGVEVWLGQLTMVNLWWTSNS